MALQNIFKRFARKARNQIDVKIKKIWSGNGMESKNITIEDFLDEEWIICEFFDAYTPQQNGVVGSKKSYLDQNDENIAR